MALPRKLKYLNMFNDGLSYMGVVESVTLPKLTRKLEKYRGGGMPGSVSIDLGLDDDALSCEWTLGGLPDVELWAQYASQRVRRRRKQTGRKRHDQNFDRMRVLPAHD